MRNKYSIKLLFLLAGMSFVNISLKGQEDAGVGVQAGINVNSWYGKDIKKLVEDKSSFRLGYNLPEQGAVGDGDYMEINGGLTERIGWHAGFEINSELTYFIWLKHEFLFYNKGFSYQGIVRDAQGNELGPGKLTFRSYHVDVVPIAVDIHFGRYQIFGGPYFSVMIDDEWKFEYSGNLDYAGVDLYDVQYKDIVVGAEANENYGTLDDEKFVSRRISSLDYGLILGGEMDLPHDFNIGFFVKQGIKTLIDTPTGQDKPHVYNRSLNFSLGYVIGGH